MRSSESTTIEPSSLWRAGRWAAIPVALATSAFAFSACSSGSSGTSVSGTVNGQNYSAATGQLPAGFPSDVPTPSNSHVIGGGGGGNNWSVVFGVSGSVQSATTAYQSKLMSAGYTIANSTSGASSSAAGAAFSASSSKWMLQVGAGSSATQPTSSALKSGEFALALVVTPATGAASP